MNKPARVMTRTGADTIGARLAHIASRFPDRAAIIERGTRVTFRELDTAASRIAADIVAAAHGRPGRVCLYFDSKLPALEALFGAGRAGYPYVLLDAGDPEERLRFIAEDSAPLVMLTEASLLERASGIVPQGCSVLDVAPAANRASTHVEPSMADPDSLVYLCYTSGSTGRPKGVMQTHRNLIFFADAYARALDIGSRDRLSLLYTLSFNAANMDIFGGLLAGGALCCYDMRRDGIPQLADWLDRERITVLHAVPTVFRELFERLPQGRVLPHLRVVDLGGEAVFGSDVAAFRRHTLSTCIFVNQLASTEVGLIAQHVATHTSSDAADTFVPAGRCPEGVHVEIRSPDGGAAPVGEAGELVVCSAYVSPGYWRRPDLDADAFSIHPSRSGVRRYASGDLGRVDAAGNLHFLGRMGSRVKIRGHSVDLVEVEAALAACEGVAKAAVVAHDEATQPGAVRLVAFVTLHDGAAHDALSLRREIGTRVPAYMLPSRIVFRESLPLTPSGKVDRSALPLDETAASAQRSVAAPQDEVERTVARVFEELLEVAPVGRDDDFFLLGGDSLRGVELQVRLRARFGVQVGNLHAHATVAGIAATIRRTRGSSSGKPQPMPVLLPLWREGSATPLFLVHGRHGQAFVSPRFMHLLGDDQPVWVFQARGLDGLREPHPSVEAMAADYLDALRKERPRGPYFLGALCAGAYIAGIIARELQAAGETVLPLLLLDPPERLLNGGYTQMPQDRFRQKMKARRALGASMGPVDDPAYLESVLRVAMAFEQAIARYRAIPYDGPVYMLSSRQRIAVQSDPLRSLFTGAVERHEVGGTHAEALDPRNPVFADRLLRCVEAVHAGTQPG